MKLSNATSKFIEEWIKRYPEMEEEQNTSKSLESIVLGADKTHPYTAALTSWKAYTRVKEAERIRGAIFEVLVGLEKSREDFVSEYYWGSTKKTIEAAARAAFVSERTGKQWKQEFIEEIAQRLGWF